MLRWLPARPLGGAGLGWQTYIFNVALEPDEDGWRVFYPLFGHIDASTWGKTQAEAL